MSVNLLLIGANEATTQELVSLVDATLSHTAVYEKATLANYQNFNANNFDLIVCFANRYDEMVKKYGKENFSREILEFFENATDAYLKEALLVNHIFLLRPDVYNRTHGGKGGYNNISDEGKIRISESRTGTVVAIKNGQIISVSKDIFDSDETLVGHTKGFVTVTDGTKYFQVSVNDERYTAGLLVPPSTNLVVAIDKETGERVVVTKSVFDLNDQLVGNTYGSV